MKQIISKYTMDNRKTMSEAADNAETIEDVILAYCEGNSYLEFDRENLGEMIHKITHLITKKVRKDHNEFGGYVDDAIGLIEDMK